MQLISRHVRREGRKHNAAERASEADFLPQLSLDTSLPLLSENSLLSVHGWWRPLGTVPPLPLPTSPTVTEESLATLMPPPPLWLTSATDDIFPFSLSSPHLQCTHSLGITRTQLVTSSSSLPPSAAAAAMQLRSTTAAAAAAASSLSQMVALKITSSQRVNPTLKPKALSRGFYNVPPPVFHRTSVLLN